MAAAAMKHMASNFAKLDKLEGMVGLIEATEEQNRKRSQVDNETMSAEDLILNCGKPGHLKKDCKGGKAGNKANGLGTNGLVDGSTNSLKGIESTTLAFSQPLNKMKFDPKHARLCQVYFKRMHESKDGDLCDLHATPSLGNKKYFVTFIDDASRFCYVYLLQSKDEALDKFKVFKTEVELQQGSQIKRFRTDRGGEYMDTLYFQAVVRLPDPKLKTLGERGIECIFVVYVEHSKAFRFYVIELNDSVSINSIIESRDAIFDKNRFSSVPRPTLRIPNGTEDIGGSVVLEEVTEEVVQQPEPEFRKSKRNRTPKDFGPEFQLYLIEGTTDEKEAINDEMDSIMGNNTWVLADLPPGCKPLGCKWIFKRKLKVDGTIEKFKAMLVIQGFKQKSGIDYFDTYALVARISTIRMLIAMTSIHNLVIHHMDVKIAFLNGDLDEEVYMNQPQGSILPGNENK
ncbi:zinc finger, CCHC-type containing protein, partial [Tanacetum coccineum]